MKDDIDLPPLPEHLLDLPLKALHDIQSHTYHAIKADRQHREDGPTFKLGDHVRKTKGSNWRGHVVGTYSTDLTPEGYAVESDTETGSVQIYPAHALELVS